MQLKSVTEAVDYLLGQVEKAEQIARSNKCPPGVGPALLATKKMDLACAVEAAWKAGDVRLACHLLKNEGIYIPQTHL